MRFPKPKREAKVPKPIKRTIRVRKVKKTSRGKMGRTADRLFSLIVRHRGCAEHTDSLTPCSGPRQCAHIVSRSYRSVRWDEENALCLCAGAHMYYTHHPLEWERFVRDRIGAETFEMLKLRAMSKWNGDLEGVCVRLAARAVALGIKP